MAPVGPIEVRIQVDGNSICGYRLGVISDGRGYRRLLLVA